MKPKEQPRPTLEEFVNLAREEFRFLVEFGFAEAPLPQHKPSNQFQVRFTNGKLTIVVEGIKWGVSTDVHIEDAADARVPLVMFVPREQRETQAKNRGEGIDQFSQIHTAAQRVREHCVDLLQGNMMRFHDRAAEWSRMTTGHGRLQQKRSLP